MRKSVSEPDLEFVNHSSGIKPVNCSSRLVGLAVALAKMRSAIERPKRFAAFGHLGVHPMAPSKCLAIATADRVEVLSVREKMKIRSRSLSYAILVACSSIALAACGGSTGQQSGTSTLPPTPDPAPAPSPTPAPAPTPAPTPSPPPPGYDPMTVQLPDVPSNFDVNSELVAGLGNRSDPGKRLARCGRGLPLHLQRKPFVL
jgi:hypothetical protein